MRATREHSLLLFLLLFEFTGPLPNYINFLNINMNFLKSLFVGKDKVSCNKEAELQWRVHRNIAEDSCSLRHTASIPKKKLSSKVVKKEGNKTTEFDLFKESGSLPGHLVQINKVKVMAQQMEIDLGLLVGVIGPQQCLKNLIPINCFQVPIGPGQEIASPRFLRKGSLDTLVVGWSDLESADGVWEELIESGEQLFVMAESWRAVKKIFVTVQQILLQRHKDKYLEQVGNKLITNIYQVKNQFFIHFESKNTLVSHLTQKHSLFESPELTQRLMKAVTLEEYSKFRKSKGSGNHLQKHVRVVKEQLEKELIIRSLEETFITKLVAEKLKEEEENVPYVIQQEGQDFETEYYKRESQKETRQSGSRKPENSDLYYFIEEHSSEEGSNAQEETGEVGNEPLESVRSLVRSNSENLKHHFEQIDADEQFFTKY